MHSIFHAVKGLIKSAVLDLQQTNVALIGSDIDHKVRMEASNGEPAWNTAGKQQGLQAWRVNQFKLEGVPEKEVSQFHEGDAYIVLQTIKTGNSFKWDIFFWLGQFCTQDEAGTAAYKTVELDDHLGTAPTQHREVQGHESEEFLELFKNRGGIKILKGGYDTGFHHVEPEKYQPRLLKVHGTTEKSMRITEADINASSLNSSDVFILDSGIEIYQFNGKFSKPIEKNRARSAIADMQQSRGKLNVHVAEEGDKDLAAFWKFFGGEQPIAKEGPQEPSTRAIASELYSVEDNNGRSSFSLLASGMISKSLLDSNRMYVLDSGDQIFIWVGKNSQPQQRKMALQRALDYVNVHHKPPYVSLERVIELHETPSFQNAIAA